MRDKILIKRKKDFFRSEDKLPVGQGFSLVELLVVIAIIGIMTAVILAVGLGNKAKKDLDAATREVESIVRLAHNYALTGKGADSSDHCRFKFVRNSTNYRVEDCTSENYSLKNGVKFMTSSGYGDYYGDYIDFKNPHGISENGNGNHLRIVLRKRSSGGSWIIKTICVDESGSVRNLEGNVSCGF